MIFQEECLVKKYITIYPWFFAHIARAHWTFPPPPSPLFIFLYAPPAFYFFGIISVEFYQFLPSKREVSGASSFALGLVFMLLLYCCCYTAAAFIRVRVVGFLLIGWMLSGGMFNLWGLFIFGGLVYIFWGLWWFGAFCFWVFWWFFDFMLLWCFFDFLGGLIFWFFDAFLMIFWFFYDFFSGLLNWFYSPKWVHFLKFSCNSFFLEYNARRNDEWRVNVTA